VADLLIVNDNPDVVIQYLAVIDPGSGTCVYLEELYQGKGIGIEIIDNNNIAIAGLFTNFYRLEDKVVTAPIYKDIYFALRDKVEVSSATDMPKEILFSLYPNPAHDLLRFSDVLHRGAVIYTTQGIIVRHIGAGVHEVDISALTPGVYFISSLLPSGKVNRKFVKF
jgi:hypothetical protein